MPLFGKPRAERQAEEQRLAAGRQELERMQATFSSAFKAWAEHIAQAHVDTAAGTLTDDILHRAGRLPAMRSNLLSQSQQYYIRSYARSYAQAVVESHRNAAIVAADHMEKKSGDGGRVDLAVGYWRSVESYLADVI